MTIDLSQAPIRTLPFEFWEEPVGARAEVSARIAVTGVPSSTQYEVEHGDSGPVVFAVQKALNATSLKDENKIAVDREYGDATELAVKRFQEKKDLYVDGVFGQGSSLAMSLALYPKVRSATIPNGLLRGLVTGESGALIGAINNSVAGGRDVSYCQRRIYESDYNSPDVVERAFDPLYQMNLFASRLRSRKDAYLARSAVDTHEWAWRLSTLYHNYPYAADKIATVGVNGLSSYWFTPQSWVQAIGAHMDDGTAVQTPLGWCKFYALGAPEYDHKGRMVQFVSDWIS